MKTDVYKDQGSWRAKTSINLSEARVLVIKTYRLQSGYPLVTNASVWRCRPDGGMSQLMGFGSKDGDFSSDLCRSRPERLSQKLVQQQHEAALLLIEQVKQLALSHYAAKDAVPADMSGVLNLSAGQTQGVSHVPN